MKDRGEGMPRVPVSVDAVREIDGVPMVRCVYLLVESDDPDPRWTLVLGGTRIPFLMLGLSGILFRPDDGEELFLTADRIEETFVAIESIAGLSVEMGDVWHPRLLFGEALERGDVSRVDLALVRDAVAFRNERIGIEEFVARVDAALEERGPSIVESSPEEAEAFREWNRRQVRDAIELYPKAESLALDWRSDEGGRTA